VSQGATGVRANSSAPGANSLPPAPLTSLSPPLAEALATASTPAALARRTLRCPSQSTKALHGPDSACLSSTKDRSANPIACRHTMAISGAIRSAWKPNVDSTFSPSTGNSSGKVVEFHPVVSVNVRGLRANSFTTSASYP